MKNKKKKGRKRAAGNTAPRGQHWVLGRANQIPLSFDSPRSVGVDSRLDVNVKVDAALNGLPAYAGQGSLADRRERDRRVKERRTKEERKRSEDQKGKRK